jgi:uncharacterized membrane protein
MKAYRLTGTQNFYGSKQPYTYYKVKPVDVWAKARYMAKEFNLPAVFVYEMDTRKGSGVNNYIGSYSAKYDNFRTPNGQLHKTYNF